MKKTFLLLLVGCLCMSFASVPIHAVEFSEIEAYRWSNVVSMRGSISFNGRTGNYVMTVEGETDVSRISATATLYYKNASGNWIEIPKNWSYDVRDDILLVDESFTGVSGREYKIVLDATVYLNGYGEPVTKTTYGTCP